MATYGITYLDDRGVYQDFEGSKSFVFANIEITKDNLSGSVTCPTQGGITVVRRVNVDFWVDSSTFKTFNVSVSGRVVSWRSSLIKGASITSPTISLICIVGV